MSFTSTVQAEESRRFFFCSNKQHTIIRKSRRKKHAVLRRKTSEFLVHLAELMQRRHPIYQQRSGERERKEAARSATRFQPLMMARESTASPVSRDCRVLVNLSLPPLTSSNPFADSGVGESRRKSFVCCCTSTKTTSS